ncbi:MAG: ral stress protein [Paenibacillus sp.]|jgi:RecB family endonuclease NucS|nr:ral stress protein [Paenibacillus sp.]
MSAKPYVKLVDNAARAMEEIDILHRQGILREDTYVVAHSKERTDDLAYAADVNTITTEEEGILNTVANLFRSRGDELRAKLESVGLSPSQAQQYESELDEGKVLILVKNRVHSYES